MLIRADFESTPQLPPRFFLEQIMDKLSKAYCFLWDRKDEENKIDMSWKDISRFYNKNAFRTNLRKLNNEGLLNYEESIDGICIELVAWDEMEEDI